MSLKTDAVWSQGDWGHFLVELVEGLIYILYPVLAPKYSGSQAAFWAICQSWDVDFGTVCGSYKLCMPFQHWRSDLNNHFLLQAPPSIVSVTVWDGGLYLTDCPIIRFLSWQQIQACSWSWDFRLTDRSQPQHEAFFELCSLFYSLKTLPKSWLLEEGKM